MDRAIMGVAEVQPGLQHQSRSDRQEKLPVYKKIG